MHFFKITLFLASGVALVHGLALPNTDVSSVYRSRDAASELGIIVARDFTCPVKHEAQCKTCPIPTLRTGKCPTGATCKRGEKLDTRVVVGMDQIKSKSWGPGKLIETSGLSVCTVMSVYDQNNWVMAHIPPARMVNEVLTATSAQLIAEYSTKMTAAVSAAHMQKPLGYLLVSKLMGTEERESLKSWFATAGIQATVRLYNPEDTIKGSGNFVVSRETQSWPPLISFL